MDPLSDVLTHLKPRGYVTGAISAGNPWSLGLPSYRGIKYYMVVRGEYWLVMEGQDPLQMGEGSCAILPHGRPFRIASDPGLTPIDARDLLSCIKRHNGVLPVTPGDDFLMLGSHFDVEGDAQFLLSVLPSVVVIADRDQSESMRWSIQRILNEMRDPRPGGTLIAQQAAYTVLVDALRLFVGTQENCPGWFQSLADPQIGKALSCIHDDPARAWTLEDLAHASGLSRTSLAQRFRRSVGETPMSYLTRWRMMIAESKLRAKREGLASISETVGYRSQSAFCAAFKRIRGVSPRQFVLNQESTEAKA